VNATRTRLSGTFLLALICACGPAGNTGGTDSGVTPPPADSGGPVDSGINPETDAGPSDAGPADAGSTDAGTMDGGHRDGGVVTPDGGLALGTAVESSVTCSGGAAAGASCMDLAITCDGLSNTVQLAVSTPTGTVKGTITTHGGGSGTGYWGAQGAENFVTPYLQAGYRVVQLKWNAAWENGSLGLRHSGCFPATAYDWIFNHLHGADRSKGFCGQGSSGGSASLGYSLTQYGLGGEFDYVLLANGPAVADLAVGCDVQDFHGTVPQMCPSIPDPVWPVPQLCNGMEQTTTCSCTTAGCTSAADMTKWVADGVVSPTSQYAYPQTAISFYMCGNNNTNGSTIGAFYWQAIEGVSGNDVSAHCWGGDAGPSSTCQVENLFTDPQILASAIATMTDPVGGCVPRH
jgi:hypothetical protein